MLEAAQVRVALCHSLVSRSTTRELLTSGRPSSATSHVSSNSRSSCHHVTLGSGEPALGEQGNDTSEEDCNDEKKNTRKIKREGREKD